LQSDPLSLSLGPCLECEPLFVYHGRQNLSHRGSQASLYLRVTASASFTCWATATTTRPLFLVSGGACCPGCSRFNISKIPDVYDSAKSVLGPPLARTAHPGCTRGTPRASPGAHPRHSFKLGSTKTCIAGTAWDTMPPLTAPCQPNPKALFPRPSHVLLSHTCGVDAWCPGMPLPGTTWCTISTSSSRGSRTSFWWPRYSTVLCSTAPYSTVLYYVVHLWTFFNPCAVRFPGGVARATQQTSELFVLRCVLGCCCGVL